MSAATATVTEIRFDTKLSYNLKEAVAATGLGERYLVEQINKGTLRAKRSGVKSANTDEPAGKHIILRAELADFLSRLPDG